MLIDMATENEYYFQDGKPGPSGSNWDRDSTVFSDTSCSIGSSRMIVNPASLQNEIDCLTKSLEDMSEDRDQLLDDRCSDRSQIIKLSAKLLQKESQIAEIFQIEEKIKTIRNELETYISKQQIIETEDKTAMKTKMADQVVIIQCLQLKAAKEKKVMVDKDEELRKQILNFEKVNTDLTEEIVGKMRLLAEWKDKFELLTKENARLVSTIRRLSDSQFAPQLVECFSCKHKFDPDADARENECFYHPLPQMGYIQWQRWPVGDKIDKQRYHTYHYYACCNTLSKQRPVGCITGRHHVNWNINLCAIFQENERFMRNDDQSPTIIDN